MSWPCKLKCTPRPPPPLPQKKEGKKLREKTKPVAQTRTLTSKDINCSDKIATIALKDTERPIFHFATVSNLWKQYTCFQHDWHVKNDRHVKLAIHHEHIYRMCVPSCPNEMIGYFRDNVITITSVIWRLSHRFYLFSSEGFKSRANPIITPRMIWWTMNALKLTVKDGQTNTLQGIYGQVSIDTHYGHSIDIPINTQSQSTLNQHLHWESPNIHRHTMECWSIHMSRLTLPTIDKLSIECWSSVNLDGVSNKGIDWHSTAGAFSTHDPVSMHIRKVQ